MAVRRIDVGLHVVQSEPATVAVQQSNGSTRITGNAATFVVVNVGQFVADNFVSGTRMDLDGDLVGHCARRTEKPRLMSCQFGTASLQGLDAIVFPKNVISERCLLHGETHLLRGLGDGVAPQVHQRLAGEVEVGCLSRHLTWHEST